jgi:hypothetical protein
MPTNFASHFVTKTMFFYTLAEDRPGWLQEAVYDAHRGALPNDWIFEECRHAVEAFDSGELTSDEDDDVHSYADGRVDVHTKDLYQWAAEFCLTETFSEAEEEAKDMGMPEETLDRIRCIQYAAIRHIADTMKEACRGGAARQEKAT